MKTALIITTFNRPEYLSKCLDSIYALTEWPDMVLIVDDGSTDPETKQLIQNFDLFQFGCLTVKVTKPQNKGIKDSLLLGLGIAQECDLFINLDGDAIVKPNLITELKRLKLANKDFIVSGFNSLNKMADGNLRNPIIKEFENCYIKQYANGINMCFDKVQMNEIIVPALVGPGNWDYETKSGFIIAKPSLVQHIGINSSMGHTDNPDVAADFYQLELPSVTLFGIDAHDPAGLTRAAHICTQAVQFGAVKIITERLFSGREAYSKFCIQDMAKYIDTSHVLIIHPDGYIQNPGAWNDEWLQYDYIGATWWYKDGKNNGNGGFSLRSKKLLDILATLDLEVFHPEDSIICRDLRKWLEETYQIKFAPDDVCNRFSIEAYNVPAPDNKYSGQFGFHGHHVSGLPVPMAPRPVSSTRQNIRHVNSSLRR